jgi:hypothetical protein
MSENKSHFRIKKGDTEIEFEGTSSEVTSKFEEIIEWIKATPSELAGKKPEKNGEPKGQAKAEKRGGARTSVISPAIDELAKDGFLSEFKTVSEVLEELRRKNVPVSDSRPVNLALNRRVPKTLDRIKDNQGRWVYRKKS